MKTLFFYVHWIGIIIVNFGWVFSPYIKYVQACVLMLPSAKNTDSNSRSCIL